VVPPLDCRRAAKRHAANRDVAGIRFEQSNQQVGEGHLACAGRAADAEERSRRNSQIETLDAGTRPARSVIVEADVAKYDFALFNRGSGSQVGQILSGEIVFEAEKFRVRGNRAGELLQQLAHLHCRCGDAGKNEKHCQDDRRLHVEQHQADKGNQRADQSGDDRSCKPVAILLTKISELLALEPVETVLKFGAEIGLAVLPGGELQSAEELRGLMHQFNAEAA
jgi:hypothetical protein